jgi:hypothetical protein
MKPNRMAVIGLVNTNFAGAVSGLTWMILAMIHHKGKAPIVEICNGAICGLAAVTPGAGFFHPSYACLCGFTSTFISFYFVKIKKWLMDDSLDAFAIHGVQGIYGTLFAGIFASKDVAATGGWTINGGWVDGNFVQLAIQLAGVAFVFAWAATITFILFMVLAVTPGMGWRVTAHEERIGLDQSQHGEDSYIFEDLETLEYINGEKEEGIKNCTKVLFHDFYVSHENRPPKAFFTKREKSDSKKRDTATSDSLLEKKKEEIEIRPSIVEKQEIEIEMKDHSMPNIMSVEEKIDEVLIKNE